MNVNADALLDKMYKKGKSDLEIQELAERDVIRLLIHYPDQTDEFIDELKDCFNQFYKPFYTAIWFYWHQYAKAIPAESLIEELKHRIGGNDQALLEAALEHVNGLYGDEPIDADYIAQKVRTFIKFQKFLNGIHKASEDFIRAKKKNDVEALAGIVDSFSNTIDVKSKLRPKMTQLSSVETEYVNWLWHPYIPLGKLTLIEGDPSCGKTFLALAIAKMVTNGEITIAGNAEPAADVVFMTAEDGVKDTIKPRFEAMGGDCSRFYCLEGMSNDQLITLDNIPMLEKAIEGLNPKLIIIDPLQAFLGAKVDMHRANEVRPILAGLGRFAEAHGIAVVVIRHLAKSVSKAAYRGMGSIDITAAARSVLLVGANPEDPNERAFAPTKSSLVEKGAVYGFKIEDDSYGKPMFTFTGESHLSVDDLLANPAETSKTDEAENILKTMLIDGPKTPKEIKKFALENGISFDTFKRAKLKLDVISECVDKKTQTYNWKLPPGFQA